MAVEDHTVSDVRRLFCPVKVHAEETGSYLSELSDEMDYGKLDTFLENYGVEQVSFSGLVEELMQDGGERRGENMCFLR